MPHKILWHSVQAACGILMMSLLLSACSTAEKIPEYRGDRMSPPLEIPPDLDKPIFNERMKIPELPAANEGTPGSDESESAASDTRSIEKPPVFLEQE